MKLLDTMFPHLSCYGPLPETPNTCAPAQQRKQTKKQKTGYIRFKELNLLFYSLREKTNKNNKIKSGVK